MTRGEKESGQSRRQDSASAGIGTSPEGPSAVLVLVVGVSGAGKSAAVDTLADLGFFTVENLPVPLFSSLLEFVDRSSAKIPRAAVSLDLDSRVKVEQLLSIWRGAGADQFKPSLIFLDCKTEVIVKRYGQTRRPHPGFDALKDSTLGDAITRERHRLFPLKEIAHLVVDTSELNIHELRREIVRFAQTLVPGVARAIRVNFLSFGFKHGVPIDCDLVLDVRFLPNPYFVDELRDRTGEDAAVNSFVQAGSRYDEVVQKTLGLLQTLLPAFADSGKSYVNIGIGCTGGRHRSVTVAIDLQKRLAAAVDSTRFILSAKHRDIEKH